MSDWHAITCEDREALIDSLGRSHGGFSKESGVGVHSGSTDMSPGGLIFTEWGYRTGDERPVLRDFRWNESDRPCEHYAFRSAPEQPTPAEEGR